MMIELKHLTPYLPYELKAIDTRTKEIRTVKWTQFTYDLKYVGMNHLLCEGFIIAEHKPILRPMSDLIKPILKGMIYKRPLRFLKHGGTDIDELRKTTNCFGETEYSCCDNEGHETRYNVKEMTFTQRYNGETRYYKDHYESITRLFEWHFDIFGLIEKGLAIDINSLENE